MLEKIAAWLCGWLWDYAGWMLMGAALAVGFGAGWAINGWRLSGDLEHERLLRAKEVNAAQSAHIAVLEKAREQEAQGEALAQKQAALEAANAKLGKERDDAIRKLTTGRACLDAHVVRLLNADAAGYGLKLPAASGLAPGPAAGASANTGIGDRESDGLPIPTWRSGQDSPAISTTSAGDASTP